jgi:hypothetical protein
MIDLPKPDLARPIVIAFRVWMDSRSLGEPEPGGIHIASLLEETSAIEARYQMQWLETFRGYIVEVVEPVAFAPLAIVAASLIRFDPVNLFLLIGSTPFENCRVAREAV